MVLIWGEKNDSMYLTFQQNKEDNHIISVNAEKKHKTKFNTDDKNTQHSWSRSKLP